MAHYNRGDEDSITPAPAVPGTEVLMDMAVSDDTEKQQIHFRSLQHVEGKEGGHLLLVPQPSLTDVNDPLRWTQTKKWLVLGNGIFYAFNGAVTGPIMAAGMIQLAAVFHTNLAHLAYANGAALICQGVLTTIWMPFAIKYGRRPVYLTSNFLLLILCVWLGIASNKTYPMFLVARALLGLVEAPIESIVPSTVADIFFLHERGAMISTYGLSVLAGNEIGPLLSAYIIQYLSVSWAFYIVSMFVGLNMVTMLLYMPETIYHGKRPSIILSVNSTLQSAPADEKEEVTRLEDVQDVQTNDSNVAPTKKTYLQELKYVDKSRIDHSTSLWRLFLRPYVLCAYPTIMWASLIYGMSLSWNVILGCSIAQLFGFPPYNFNSGGQGLTFLGPFIGSLIGTYLCGPMADRIATWFTARNGGIREPEMRLPVCIVAAAFTAAGAIITAVGFGYNMHWAVPVVGFGVLSVGAQMGASLSMTYALDCHKELSAELMVTVSVLKSALAWIWTWVTNNWITAQGAMTVFLVVMAVNLVVYASTFVLYYRGKAIRLWIYEMDFLKRTGLE